MPKKQKFSFGQRAAFWLAANLAGRVLGLIFRTCRVEILCPDFADLYIHQRTPCIAAAWHRSAIFFLYFFRAMRPAIMVSASRDGEYLARFISMMGGRPVRGSSHRGGPAALKAMVEAIKKGECTHAATVADGPTGPRYKAKKGMILLAQKCGLPLIPIMWSCDRAWVLKNSWDRTMIPKPFAKVRINAGEPMNFPPKMTAEQMKQAQKKLEEELNRITRELDRMCGRQDPE